MIELLRLLANELIFLIDPHGYSLVSSTGTAQGNAAIELSRGSLTWRLVRDRGEAFLDLRLDGDPEYVSYTTDILKRWISGSRDDEAALLTEATAVWLEETSRRSRVLWKNRVATTHCGLGQS